MTRELAVIVEINSTCIILSDDYGDSVPIFRSCVVGEPRLGATVTLIIGRDRNLAFVEPPEKVERISSDPNESGVVLIGHYIDEEIRAAG
jgi:hypothetical protein